MTVRLAQDVGMPLIAEYAKRFGVYDDLPTYLSFALGAGETTVMRMVSAYSMFANGGKRIKPTLIDRIQDRYGHTIFRHDQRECRGCQADKWAEPARALDGRPARAGARPDDRLPDHLDDGRRGPARHRDGVVREVGKPVAGKTGTTNDEKDVWFIGFSPDMAVGVYLGYDKPRHIGNRATGGGIAAPIVKEFLKHRARRQAGGAVPRAARHQADPHRSEVRHAHRGRLARRAARSLQAGHRAARQLFDHRLSRAGDPPSADGCFARGRSRGHAARPGLYSARGGDPRLLAAGRGSSRPSCFVGPRRVTLDHLLFS